MTDLEKEIVELEQKANQLAQTAKARPVDSESFFDYQEGFQDGERLMAQKAMAIIKQFQEEKAMAIMINTTGLYIIKPGVAPQLIRPNGVCNHCKGVFDENQRLKDNMDKFELPTSEEIVQALQQESSSVIGANCEKTALLIDKLDAAVVFIHNYAHLIPGTEADKILCKLGYPTPGKAIPSSWVPELMKELPKTKEEPNLQKTEEVQLTLKDNASCCNNKGETEIGKEVRKAMEELRNEFTLQDYCNANKSPSDWTDVMNICREARNLLDALDKQDAESQYFCGNNHELPQNDLFSACKKCEGKFPDQEILSEKTQENAKNLPSGKSLWKSVNELRPGHDVIVKYQDESCELHKTIAWQSEDPRGGIWFKHGEYAKSKPPEDAVFITLTDYINNIEERLRKLEGRTK